MVHVIIRQGYIETWKCLNTSDFITITRVAISYPVSKHINDDDDDDVDDGHDGGDDEDDDDDTNFGTKRCFTLSWTIDSDFVTYKRH